MNELIEAIEKAALENIVALLRDPDPMVRLETSLAILDRSSVVPDESMDEAYAFQAAERDDMAELDEFAADMGAPAVDVPETGEVLEAITDQASAEAEAERQLAAAQVTRDEMPAGFKPGRSMLGSGEQRR
jgi:hypothetical protein